MKKIGAAIAAASLVPASFLIPARSSPPAPKDGPPVVTIIDDPFGNSPLELQMKSLQGAKLTRAEIAKLTPAQKQAYQMLRALFDSGTEQDEAALRRLIPEAPSAIAIDRKTVTSTAAQLAREGFPLTPGGVASFQASRAIPRDVSARDLGLAYARALEGHEIVFEVPGNVSASQAKALELLRAMSRGELEKLPAGLGIHRDERDSLVVPAAALDQFMVQRIGPRPDGERARAEWYQRILESQGHVWRDGVDQVNVIGLQGFDVDHGRNPNAFNRWNDTIAFVWKTADGGVQVREYRATTDPGLASYYDSPDVDGNGSGDVANLLPGQYPYHVGTHRGQYGAGNPGYNLPVARDTNHDGDVGPAEVRASIERGDVGLGINLHWGPGSGASEVGIYSLGCQVLQMNYGSFLAEVTPLLEANRGELQYSLVDMNQLA